ncbi:MAG: transposase family protein [Chloroflexi bacterium]|nr:transposase family protein [Chloroflexota bacterium]
MPGHFEVDTVHHCGDSAQGIYAYTIQLVDVASGWSEIVPVYGNSFVAMKDGFDYLFTRLPFPVLEFHPDNGSEFINNLLLKHWRELVPNLDITRSKPYRKNDNRFVEENNNSLIRAYIGPSRFDTAAQLGALRELEELLWLYHNCFLPCMRLSEKSVSAEGNLRKSFDSAQPPLDRLLASDLVDKSRLIELFEFRKAINPLLLREKISQSIQKLLALPCLGPQEQVDFYKTRLNVKEPSVTLSFELTEAVR